MLPITVREMLRTHRREDLKWDVSLDGSVVGWVRAHRIGRSSVTFYEATGIDPMGEPVCLESSGDRENRITIVIAFSKDPEPWRGIQWHPRSALDIGADSVG